MCSSGSARRSCPTAWSSTGSAGDGWQRVRLRTTAPLTGIATGSFPTTERRRRAAGRRPTQTSSASPTRSSCCRWWPARASTSTSSRPPTCVRRRCSGCCSPASARRFAWIAPLDHPHEQVIAVADGALRWGWHGDLDDVPADFSSTLGIFEGDDARGGARAVGRRSAGGTATAAPGAANPITSHLSYWTDNGAAYWYRTEAGRTIGASVAEAVAALVADGVPIRAVELDSGATATRSPVRSPRSATRRTCRRQG